MENFFFFLLCKLGGFAYPCIIIKNQDDLVEREKSNNKNTKKTKQKQIYYTQV